MNFLFHIWNFFKYTYVFSKLKLSNFNSYGQIPDKCGYIYPESIRLFRAHSGFHVFYQTDSGFNRTICHFDYLTKIISSFKLRINFGLIRTFSGIDLLGTDKFQIQAKKFQIIFGLDRTCFGKKSQIRLISDVFGQILESGICPKFLAGGRAACIHSIKNLSFGKVLMNVIISVMNF